MINITTADKDYIKEIIEIRMSYLKDDFGDISKEEDFIINELKSYLPEHLNKDLFVYLAKKNEKILGTAFLLIVEKPASPIYLNGRTGLVLNVFTYPEYRNKGIATKLMEFLISEGKKKGLCKIDLMATQMGAPIYQRLGFKFVESNYKDMELVFKVL